MMLKRTFVAVLFAVASFGLVAAAGPAALAAEEPFKQVKLSEKLIQSFIAAQKDLAVLAQKNPPTETDKPDPKIQAELEAIAKKHGFASFAEFDDVAFNISFVMGGIDPQSGSFTDQITQIKKEIEDVKADRTVPDDQKKQMLADLDEALKNTPPLKFPENIEVVKKFHGEIAKVLQ
ncbi:MAG: hypothetical protein ACKVP7_12995 [Hyphomicrobiaceae bacterium]